MATFRELITVLHEHPGHTVEWYAGALKMDDVERVSKALKRLENGGVIEGSTPTTKGMEPDVSIAIGEAEIVFERGE